MVGNARRFQQQGDPNAGRALPGSWTQDAQTGQFRPKTWWEKHGDEVGFVGDAAANFASAGLFGGAGGLTSAATEGGSKGMGFFDTLKQGFDLYNKAAPVIDTVTGKVTGLSTPA